MVAKLEKDSERQVTSLAEENSVGAVTAKIETEEPRAFARGESGDERERMVRTANCRGRNIRAYLR